MNDIMLYFKYKKFIKIFKYVKKMNDYERLEWTLEDKYGDIANEAVSILNAKGGLKQGNCFQYYPIFSQIDAIILEYEDKCSSMFWNFVKWLLGTAIAVAGLIIAYLSFVNNNLGG